MNLNFMPMKSSSNQAFLTSHVSSRLAPEEKAVLDKIAESKKSTASRIVREAVLQYFKATDLV